MKFTRIKTTMMAGMLAASMLMPGMTAMAAKSEADGSVTTAQIQKTVTVNTNVADIAGQTVQFTVEQDDTDVYQITNGISTKSITFATTDTTKDTSIVQYTDILSSDEITAITANAGEYHFTVKESSDGLSLTNGNGWTVTDTDKTCYLRVVVDNNGNATYFLSATKGETDKTKKADYASFDNTYNKKSTDTDGNATTLTVKKTVVNPEYAPSADQTYPITIEITVPTTTKKDASGKYVIDSTAYAIAGKTPTVDTAKGTVTYVIDYKNGDSYTVTNVAVGATWTVSEDTTALANTNFVKSEIDVAGGTFADGTAASPVSTVTNTFKSITVTGVVTSIAPYVTLVVLAVAAVAAYMAMKARIAR